MKAIREQDQQIERLTADNARKDDLLRRLVPVYEAALAAQFDIYSDGSVRIKPEHFRPLSKALKAAIDPAAGSRHIDHPNVLTGTGSATSPAGALSPVDPNIAFECGHIGGASKAAGEDAWLCDECGRPVTVEFPVGSGEECGE